MCGVYSNATFLKIFAPVECVVHESIADSEIATTIGEKIVLLRYSMNLTQLQFARSIHRGFSTVTKWEQELTTPSQEALDDIIRVYELAEDYFD